MFLIRIEFLKCSIEKYSFSGIISDMNLVEAVLNNDLTEVTNLLSKGFDPNEAEDEANVTPLHFAVQNNRLEIAHILLNAGANPLAQEGDGGDTPFDVAILMKDEKMISLLTWFIKQQEEAPLLLS